MICFRLRRRQVPPSARSEGPKADLNQATVRVASHPRQTLVVGRQPLGELPFSNVRRGVRWDPSL